jgi:ribose 5-phosphate isomerase B
MKIYFASDHSGFEMKEKLVPYVKELGYDVIDLGPESLDPVDDYPGFASEAAKKVTENLNDSRAIIFCSSGQGMAIVANRFPNIRAALYYGGPKEILTLSREHNNANILSLGTKFLSLDETKEAVRLWLETSFSEEERHKRRIGEIENL